MKTNSCWVIGNLGSDPVERSRHPKTGPVVGFSIAENVSSYDEILKNYKILHTNWFHVTAFGQIAERIKAHLKKGDRVAIQGKMKISKFTSKSGEEKTGFEILADDVAYWKSLPSLHSHSSSGREKEESIQDLPF